MKTVGPGEDIGKEGKVYKDKYDVQAKEKMCVCDRVKIGQEENEGTSTRR